MAGNRRHNQKGRNDGSSKHIQLHHYLLESAAWRACSPIERALYLEIAQRYNGYNNGDISLSHREAQQRLGVSNKPIIAAFRGLEDKGFIRPVVKGSFDWKRSNGFQGRATRWLITSQTPDSPEKSLVTSKDFMRWKPPEIDPTKKKTRCARSTPSGCLEHTIIADAVCPEHTH